MNNELWIMNNERWMRWEGGCVCVYVQFKAGQLRTKFKPFSKVQLLKLLTLPFPLFITPSCFTWKWSDSWGGKISLSVCWNSQPLINFKTRPFLRKKSLLLKRYSTFRSLLDMTASLTVPKPNKFFRHIFLCQNRSPTFLNSHLQPSPHAPRSSHLNPKSRIIVVDDDHSTLVCMVLLYMFLCHILTNRPYLILCGCPLPCDRIQKNTNPI